VSLEEMGRKLAAGLEATRNPPIPRNNWSPSTGNGTIPLDMPQGPFTVPVPDQSREK
jgi:hypothetical protein